MGAPEGMEGYLNEKFHIKKPTDVKPDPALIKSQNDLIRKEREEIARRRVTGGTNYSNDSGTLG